MTSADVMVDAGFMQEIAALGSGARAELTQRGLWTPQFAGRLAEAALQHAGDDRDAAGAWLSLAWEILAGRDASAETALVHYAQARMAAMSGELSQAEEHLRTAQAIWQKQGDSAWLTRSNRGLSQILTMQGRYQDAEVAIRSTIELTRQADCSQPAVLLSLAGAHRNLANVLMYQERHGSALGEYDAAAGYLVAASELPGSEISAEELNSELAHIALNRANALTFLDRHAEADAALLDAVDRFNAGGDSVNRGRARTNLGRLYLRQGRFAAALDQFDEAALDLIGEIEADADAGVEQLRQADELLLEHAAAYLALNLFQEAEHTLARCEALFRSAEQPFELARTRFTQGVLRLHKGDLSAGRDALNGALSGFEQLGNRFWANRSTTALAAIAVREGKTEEAVMLLEALLRNARLGSPSDRSINWDVSSLAEARLLHAGLQLETGNVTEARKTVALLAGELELGDIRQDDMPPIPHLAVRLEHMRGRIELADGGRESAHRHLMTALAIMERQRSSLPLEEIRTAFLDDKTSIYSDLILTRLGEQDATAPDAAEAFDIAERARSRSLLERIRVTFEDDLAGAAGPETVMQRDALRRELHWLYNQMLEDPARQQDAGVRQQLLAKEAALEKFEWRTSPLRLHAEPVKLREFQSILRGERQALVYTVLRDEVMAFVVDAGNIRAYRRLCSAGDVEAAQAELRFQLGRVELGDAYRARHRERLRRMVHDALQRLYGLLVEPVRNELHARELLVIPYGSMHLLPFHALWDGNAYLLEQYELRYAPSASLAVHGEERTARFHAGSSFSGVAIRDEDIPHARSEVLAAAQRFGDAQVYLDADASRSGLEEAASRSDILHMATHGLFRPDNSFFSALKLADGWIDVREIYRLPLAAQLVVLSACESGAGEIRGADEVVGLARGFIGAGASSLVVSLWNVHDASSAQILDRFYDALLSGDQGHRPAAALRAAQLAAIEAEQHPYYWAPFVAVG